MGLYDDLLEPKRGLYSDLLEPAKKEPEQQQTELTPEDAEKNAIADTGIGLAKGTIGLVSFPVRAGLLIADTVSEAGQRMSSALTGAPPPADQSYLPSKQLESAVDAAGRVADKLGIPEATRPTQWESKLDQSYSEGAKQAQLGVSKTAETAVDKAAEEGAGFFGKVGAGIKGAVEGIVENPYSMVPLVAENLPQIFGVSSMTKQVLKPLIAKTSAEVAAGTLTREAAEQIISKAGISVSSALEGGMTVGQVESEILSEDKDASVLQRLASIPAGILSAGISRATGIIPGLANIEGKLAVKGAVDASDSRLVSGLKGLVTEGLYEEPLQEGQEQMWTNLGLGKDLADGVGQSMVQGALAGGPMGALGGVMTGGQSKEKEQEKIVAGTVERIRNANLSATELIALRESPKALDRIGISADHINELLKDKDTNSVEVATFERLVKNAPSEAAKAGLLATERGKAYQRLVNDEAKKAPDTPKSMNLDDAITKIASRRSELSNKIDLSTDEAKELKTLNKVKYDDPSTIAKALNTTIKIGPSFDEKELETVTEGVRNLDAFKQRETLLEQWQDLQSVNVNDLPADQVDQHKAELKAVADEVNALNAQIKQTAQYKTWNTLITKARESVVYPTTSKTSTPASKTEETTAQSSTIPTTTPVNPAPAETVSAETSQTKNETPAAETTVETPAAETTVETPAAETPVETPAVETITAEVHQNEITPTETNTTENTATESTPAVAQETDNKVEAPQATQEAPVIVPNQEASDVKPARSITAEALRTKTTKRQNLLNAKVKTGNATPDQIAELRQLNEAKGDINTLAKHFKVEISEPKKKTKKAVAPPVEDDMNVDTVTADVIEEQKIKEGIKSDKEALKKLKAVNAKRDKEAAAQKNDLAAKMKAETDRVARVQAAKDAEVKQQQKILESIPEEHRPAYESLTSKERDYKAKAILAARQNDPVLAHTYQALAKQTQAEISNFKNVHSSLYKKGTDVNTSDQADSKSVQNEAVQPLNKSQVQLLSDIDGNLQANGGQRTVSEPDDNIKASKASRIRDWEKEIGERISGYAKVWFDTFGNLIDSYDSKSPDAFNKKHDIRAGIDYIAIISQLYIADDNIIVKLDPKALTERDQQAAGIQGMDLDYVAETINTARIDALNNAIEYVQAGENEGLYDVSQLALLVHALTKYNFWFDNETNTAKYSKITPRTMTTGSLFSGAIMAAFTNGLDNELSPRDAYKKAIEDVMGSKEGAHEAAGVSPNGWHKFEQSEDSTDVANLAMVAATSPAQWCTGHGAASNHLKNGDFYIYSEDGVAKIAIRMDGEHTIAEVSGSLSGQHLTEGEIDEALKFAKQENLDGEQINQIAADQKNTRLMRAWFNNGGVDSVTFDVDVSISSNRSDKGVYVDYSAHRNHQRYDNNVHLLGPDGKAFDELLNTYMTSTQIDIPLGIQFNSSSISNIEIGNLVDGIFRFPNVTKAGTIETGPSSSVYFDSLEEVIDFRVNGDTHAPKLKKAENIHVNHVELNLNKLETLTTITAKHGAVVRAPNVISLKTEARRYGDYVYLSAGEKSRLIFNGLQYIEGSSYIAIYSGGSINLPTLSGYIERFDFNGEGSSVSAPNVHRVGYFSVDDRATIEHGDDFANLKIIDTLHIHEKSNVFFSGLTDIGRELSIARSELVAPNLRKIDYGSKNHEVLRSTIVADNLVLFNGEIDIHGEVALKASKLESLDYVHLGSYGDSKMYKTFLGSSIKNINKLNVLGNYTFESLLTAGTINIRNGEFIAPNLLTAQYAVNIHGAATLVAPKYTGVVNKREITTARTKKQVKPSLAEDISEEDINNIETSLANEMGEDWSKLKSLGEAKHPGGVTIRQTVKEALEFLGASPETVQAYSIDGVSAQAFHNKETGVSVIVADNTAAEHAYGVLVHEVGVHGDANAELDQLAVDLLEEHKDTKFIQGVIERLTTAGHIKDGVVTDIEEARAYLVEEAINKIGVEQIDSKFWSKAKWVLPKGVFDFLRNFMSRVKQAFVNRGLLEPKVFSAYDLVRIAKTKVTQKTKVAGKEIKSSLIGPSAIMPEAVQSKLAQAAIMRAQGDSVRETLEATGWWEFIPGEWTYELDDSTASVKQDFFKSILNYKMGEVFQRTLDQVYDHPTLFEAYPELRNYTVVFHKDQQAFDYNEGSGAYNPGTKEITVSFALSHHIKPVLLHEIQHAIQDIEETVIGGSPDGDLIGQVYNAMAVQKLSAIAELAALVDDADNFNNFVQNLHKVKASRANEAMETFTKKYESMLADDKYKDIDTSEWLKLAKTRLMTKNELYNRLAGEAQARFNEYRISDDYEGSLEDAFISMLAEEGLISEYDVFNTKDLDFRDSLLLAMPSDESSTSSSLSVAASKINDKNKAKVYKETGWLENEDGVFTTDGVSPTVEGVIKASQVSNKVKKQKLSQDDKDAIKVLEKLYNARGKSLDTAIAEAAEDLARTPSNPMFKKLYELTKNSYGTYKRSPSKQTSSWFDRVFSSPEYYFSKTTATREILQAAIDDSDIRYQALEKIQGNFHDTAKVLIKKFPEMYKAAGKYLVDTDKSGIGFSLKLEGDKWRVFDRANKDIGAYGSEQEALEAMLQAEQEWLAKRLVAPQIRDFILASRRLTNRAFDILVEDMRKQIARNADEGLPEPVSIYVNEDGKNEEVSLSELIANMGDLRGTYFPRERVARDFHLVAEQDGMPSILETFDWHFVENEIGDNKVELMKRTFNSLSPAGRRVKELVAQGYNENNIFVKPVKTPTDTLFDLPGTLTTLDSLLTLANEKVKEDEMEEMDKKLLAAADRALAMRIADIYRAKGNLSSRMARAEKLFEGYEEDPVRALTGYASRIATGVAKRTTARRMLKAFTGRSLTFKQFKAKFGENLTYTNYMSYVKDNRIHPTKQDKLYEDARQYMQYFLAPATGAERAIGYLKAAAVFKYLGFRVMSAAVNATSLIISVPATIAGHTGASLYEVSKSMTRAMKVFAAYKHNMLLAKGHKWLGRPMNIKEDDLHIMNTIYGNGWAVAQFNHDAAQVMTGEVGKWVNNTMQAAMYMFGKVEEMNRAMTIFAAQDVLAKNGLTRGNKTLKNLSTGQRLSLAKHASDRAHGIYGKAAKPWLVQKYRFLDAAYTFQKYQHSYHLNMLELFGKYKSKKAAAYLALMPQLVAGTSTLAYIGMAIAKALGNDDPQESYETLMSKFIGKSNLAKEIAGYGIIGALTGVTLKGSLETKNPIPTDLTELAGAPQSVITDVYEAFEAAYKGQYLKSLEKAAPAFLGNVIKGYREKTEGLTKKNYAPVFYEGQRLYASTGDFIKRALSASPMKLTEMRNREWREDETRRAFTARRGKISELYNRLIVQNEPGNSDKWGEVFQKMNDYNDKAAIAPPHYMIPQIDLDWLMQQQKRNFAPTKYTKYPNDAE